MIKHCIYITKTEGVMGFVSVFAGGKSTHNTLIQFDKFFSKSTDYDAFFVSLVKSGINKLLSVTECDSDNGAEFLDYSNALLHYCTKARIEVQIVITNSLIFVNEE